LKANDGRNKLVEFTQHSLTRANFNRPEFIMETLVKIVSRSSMVSRFEKPKFRDFVRSLNSHEKQALADSFERRLYGRQKQRGFEEILAWFISSEYFWPMLSVSCGAS
jgi:hypothetical protein